LYGGDREGQIIQRPGDDLILDVSFRFHAVVIVHVKRVWLPAAVHHLLHESLPFSSVKANFVNRNALAQNAEEKPKKLHSSTY
jgi:hypothetical protein